GSCRIPVAWFPRRGRRTELQLVTRWRSRTISARRLYGTPLVHGTSLTTAIWYRLHKGFKMTKYAMFSEEALEHFRRFRNSPMIAAPGAHDIAADGLRVGRRPLGRDQANDPEGEPRRGTFSPPNVGEELGGETLIHSPAAVPSAQSRHDVNMQDIARAV